MKRFKCKRLIRAMSFALASTTALYGVTPVYAGSYDWLGLGENPEKFCMADAYLLEPGNKLAQDALNCTANDVEITSVTPLDASAECTLGQVFTFDANVKVRTNANERWDTTFYLPLTNLSPQVVHGVNKRDCSMILPIPADSGDVADVNLDTDTCGDITKANGPDEYILVSESITMLCVDEDNDNRADFTYCAAWDNISRDNCSIGEDPYAGQIPNNKSKCNCDTFNIDVFIKPDAPTLIKTLETSNTHTEAGGTYTFTASFTNPNSNTSIFLTALSDEVDTTANGTYEDSLNLWGGTSTPAGDGVYLTSTNCKQPENGGEISPSATYSCEFTVTIVDSDLPDDRSPELYNDVIRGIFKDKNGDFVTNGETCPDDMAGVDGQFCSNQLQVNVTNLPPDIRVEKVADKDTVLEPGEEVIFTVTVYNDSATYDSPVILTSLIDTIYGDLDGKGDCAINGSIVFGGNYSCSFIESVVGDKDDSFTNTVTAIARDNEFDTDSASDSHTILVLDVPSMIDLTKTANPNVVLETGDDPSIFRDVAFTFLFSVDAAGVDDVTFNALDDSVFGDILAGCNVDMFDGGSISSVPLDGYILSPGHYASCSITRGLQGNDDDSHLNVATIGGTDDDGAVLTAMDDATVEFDPVAPASDMAFATSMLVVLEMHNAGIENITLDNIKLKGQHVVDGAGNTEFTILNAVGGEYNGTSYPACNIDEVLGYNGSPSATYSCAFTIELKPGLEDSEDITFIAGIIEGIIVTFTNDDGETTSNAVGIQVNTIEP